jgi:transposase
LPGYPDGVTHWRRLRFWMKHEGYIRVWKILLRLLYKQKHCQKELLSLDGSVIESFAFKDTTGYSGYKHKMGTKISTIANKSGIPLALVIAKGNIVDISLAAPTLMRIQIPRSYIRGGDFLADAGYDSRLFRQTVVNHMLVPFIPRRKRGKTKQKYQLLYLTNTSLQKKRFVIERTNAWLKNFRRLRTRFDYTLYSFAYFIYLAILVICVRRLIN